MNPIVILSLVACGEDPVLEAARKEAASHPAAPQGSPATPPPAGAPQGGPPGEGQPAAGTPEAPPPGQPAAPNPGAIEPQGEKVTLSGELKFSSYKQGKITIDVFDGDPSGAGGKHPALVARKVVEGPGPYSLSVPKGSAFWISAFNDENQDNSPSPQEPGAPAQGPVELDADKAGFDLELRAWQAPPPN